MYREVFAYGRVLDTFCSTELHKTLELTKPVLKQNSLSKF
jgi:hypothetical protein